MGERLNRTQEVDGSIPFSSTNLHRTLGPTYTDSALRGDPMKRPKTKAGKRATRGSRDLAMRKRVRFSRDLAIALKRAEAALRKAAAAAPRSRGSRDLKVQIERAKKAVKKATAIARTTRGSRDL